MLLAVTLLTLLAYLLAALLAGQVLRGDRPGYALVAFAAAPALLLHAGVHVTGWGGGLAPDMHFFAALSLVGLGMATLTLLAGREAALRAMGVLVFPLAGLLLLLHVLAGPSATAAPADWRIALHAWLALLAYATLALGAVLALMLWLQEHALRRRRLGWATRFLPPLVQTEALLFRTVGTGFVLLSLALLTGVLFVEDLFAQHLVHKTVLSVLAWLVFGALLLGRWRLGWRGARAARLALAAMFLLLLAFFGSKFVLELVLQRAP